MNKVKPEEEVAEKTSVVASSAKSSTRKSDGERKFRGPAVTKELDAIIEAHKMDRLIDEKREHESHLAK